MDSLAKKIADAIGKYHVGFMQKKVLKTIEEIEATTDPLEKYIAGAGPVDELYNNLFLPPLDTYISINTDEYEAPYDGWAYISAIPTQLNESRYVEISYPSGFASMSHSDATGIGCMCMLPVRKGVTISFSHIGMKNVVRKFYKIR